MDKSVSIFGIPFAGKTVYLSILFDQIKRYGFGDYLLDIKDHFETMDYLDFILKDLYQNGVIYKTPSKQFKELKLKIVYKDKNEIKTAFMISTYDLSGEDIQNIFDPRFHSLISKSVVPPELRESQKKIMQMLYLGNCFILLADPNPNGYTFDEQDTMFTIILRIIKKNNEKKKFLKVKSNNFLKEIKIAFCISKCDLINVFDTKKFVEENFPFTYKYLEINFTNNYVCIPISSLGLNASSIKYPLLDSFKPFNVIEPLRFFLSS